MGTPIHLETPFRYRQSPEMRSRYHVREEHRAQWSAASAASLRAAFGSLSRSARLVTSTIIDWLPVFVSPVCCDILAQSLDFCRQHKEMHL